MSMPLPVRVVVDARKLVGDRSKRARNYDAVDAKGVECDPCHANAVRFCARGAVIRAAFDLIGDHEQAHVLGMQISAMIDKANGFKSEDDEGYGLVKLSDTRGQRAVLEAMDRFLAGT